MKWHISFEFHSYLVLHTDPSTARCKFCFYWGLHKINYITLQGQGIQWKTFLYINIHDIELALKSRHKNSSWNNSFSPPFFILCALFFYTLLHSPLVLFLIVAQLFFWRIRLAIRSSKHASQKQFISLWF